MRPSPPPKQDQRGAMEPRRVTKGSQVGSNRVHEGPQGEQMGAKGGQGGTRGAKRAPRGGRGSQRGQKGPKGVPQSELDDSYTVSEGPEGGLKGQNLQKPTVFEHS